MARPALDRVTVPDAIWPLVQPLEHRRLDADEDCLHTRLALEQRWTCRHCERRRPANA